MTVTTTRRGMMAGVAASSTLLLGTARAVAEDGVTPTEIKLGQTVALSGPASAFSSYGRVMTGFFQKINDEGGINGRKVNFTLLDNAFSPPKALEQTRRLVEDVGVFAEVGTVGTTPNVAVQKYLNDKKVPHLYISAGGRRFNDPKNFPYTVPLYPAFEMEGAVLGRYVLKTRPNAKIGVLYQNDDFGRDFLRGLKTGLGERVSMIVAEMPHEITDPTVDSQLLKLNSAGVDTLFEFTTPKFAAQAIRKANEIGWRPLQLLASPASSIEATLRPAGFEAAKDIVVTTQFSKQAGDPTWDNDKEMNDFKAFMKKYAPNDSPSDFIALSGYIIAHGIELALRRCGPDLTRENVIKQATSLKDVRLPLFLPGITISNSPEDYSAYSALQIATFDGTRWVATGGIVSGR